MPVDPNWTKERVAKSEYKPRELISEGDRLKAVEDAVSSALERLGQLEGWAQDHDLPSKHHEHDH